MGAQTKHVLLHRQLNSAPLFLQFLKLLSTLAMMSCILADAIHTHYKMRRRAKNP